MSNDIDLPPLYDLLTKSKPDKMSDIWVDWFGTFYQTLISYLSQSGIFIPQLTSAQIAALVNPANGQMVYNTTTQAPQVYQNGAWKTYTTS
jgi:hypothetical protein